MGQTADPKDHIITSFGGGNVKVRFYTDYFCGPCRAAEPKIEPVLMNLVNKNIINLTFIDTPFHRYSSLYAKYFLFILNEKRDFSYTLSVRTMLFDAAQTLSEAPKEIRAGVEKTEKPPTESEKLEGYLKKKGIRFKPFDERPVFTLFERYLREDKINSTPACVIERNGKKEMFKGGDDILKGLQGLRGR